MVSTPRHGSLGWWPVTTLLLASASPARRTTLMAAGVTPTVRVSGVDEDAVLAAARERFGALEPADAVLLLAQAKAEDVTRAVEASAVDAEDGLEQPDVVLGCDSMLELDGEIYGKPGTPEVAVERWRTMRGRSGVLHTGHWVVDLRDADAGGTGGTLGATSATTVHFADLSDAEIDDYVATGEPLAVAGGFTVDGLGGAFVTGIEGDYHSVVGVSLPLLRELLGQIGISWTDLWRAEPAD